MAARLVGGGVDEGDECLELIQMEDLPDNTSSGPHKKVLIEGQLVAVDIPLTAHQISQDTWYQAGFLLATGINSAYVLGYSAAIMVPLGWVAGGIGLVAATALSLYANCLVAKLHEFGGRRHLRYRDLAGHVYGRTAYYLTWALQYANLFIFNTGYIILAADALKAAYFLLWDNHAMKLPYFTAVAGVVCALFAVSIPHLSGLRIWLGFSTIFSLVYITTVVMLSLQDGIKSAPRDYSISGSNTSKIFRTVGATANLFFVFNTGMLPEIQATVRQPVVSNTLKALFFQFTIGAVPMYAATFVGYWAFGASSSSYLLTSVSGPVWLKIVANISAFLQSVISLHMFASPLYEYMDTKYGIKGSYSWFKMATFRIGVRGGYIVVNTFVAALLPFLGDFMSLGGAISTFPLTFVLGNHMYLTALGHKMTTTQRGWHWLNIGFFSFLSLGGAIAAVRLIAADSKTYSLFADL